MKRAGGPGSNEKPPAGFSTSSNRLGKGSSQKEARAGFSTSRQPFKKVASKKLKTKAAENPGAGNNYLNSGEHR